MITKPEKTNRKFVPISIAESLKTINRKFLYKFGKLWCPIRIIIALVLYKRQQCLVNNCSYTSPRGTHCCKTTCAYIITYVVKLKILISNMSAQQANLVSARFFLIITRTS